MINKNDKLVIFLRGSVRCRYGFLTETCRMEGENHIYFSLLSTRDQNINLSKYKKIRIVSFCGADKLMLRLHRVVVLKVTLGFI